MYWIPYSEAKQITLNSLGDGFVRPGVNGNFHHKKDYHDFDRKICRAKNATGCKFPGNWVQDNNYCHIITGRGVQKVYDDFDVLFNRRGSLISEDFFHFGLVLKQWYFVTKIVLTHCKKKMLL